MGSRGGQVGAASARQLRMFAGFQHVRSHGQGSVSHESVIVSAKTVTRTTTFFRSLETIKHGFYLDVGSNHPLKSTVGGVAIRQRLARAARDAAVRAAAPHCEPAPLSPRCAARTSAGGGGAGARWEERLCSRASVVARGRGSERWSEPRASWLVSRDAERRATPRAARPSPTPSPCTHRAPILRLPGSAGRPPRSSRWASRARRRNQRDRRSAVYFSLS